MTKGIIMAICVFVIVTAICDLAFGQAEADTTWEAWRDSIADYEWGGYDSTGKTASSSRITLPLKIDSSWYNVTISSLSCSLYVTHEPIKLGEFRFIILRTWDSAGKNHSLCVKIRYGDDVDAIVERGFDDLRARIRRKPRRSHLDPGLEDFPGMER